jgi:hypothetical protein
MSKEAMKLVVDKIKSTFWEGYVPEPVKPAQQVVDCHATGVCVQSGLQAEQPAQQEPVATLWQHGRTGRTRITMPGDITDCDADWFKAADLYTSPPAQRKPLTDEAIATVYWGATGQSLRPQDNVLAHNFARSIEAAHGIKENT